MAKKLDQSAGSPPAYDRERAISSAAPPAVCILNQTRGTPLSAHTIVARGFRARSRGLLDRHELCPGEGMLFDAALPLMWMHTLFMAFPIDIIFTDRSNVVIKIHHSLKPWRFSALV